MSRLLLMLLAILSLTQCGTKSSQSSTTLSNAISLAAGNYNTCVTQYGGRLSCWGNATTGQGGWSGLAGCTVQGLSIFCALRPGVVIKTTVLDSTIGFGHNCANAGGSAECWGDGTSGQLGNNASSLSFAPVQVQGLTSNVTSIAAGFSHSCGVMANGAYCWGNNTLGELGDGTNNAALIPVAVGGLAAGVSKVAAGGFTSCALLTSGAVQCWGANTTGQLGDGTMVASNSNPVVAIAANATAVASAVAAIPGHSCAIVSGGVKCWGLNIFGELGDGTTTNRNTPTAVVGLSSGVTAIAVGTSHSCAIVNGGAVCWGLNSSGQLGTKTSDLCLGGTTVYSCSLNPVPISGLDKNLSLTDKGVVSIAAGAAHTCAILDDLSVSCWGDNSAGQLGTNSLVTSLTPTPVVQ